MTDIERHQATIDKLVAKQTARSELAQQLEAKRNELALQAFDEGGEAAAELHALNKESIEVEFDLRNLAGAIEQVKAKLNDALRAEALEEERQRAAELHKAVETLREVGRDFDEVLGLVKAFAFKAEDAIREIHRLGSPFPTQIQFEVLGSIAVKTALTGSSLRIEGVPPNERKNFRQLTDQWAETIERSIAHLLDKQDEAA